MVRNRLNRSLSVKSGEFINTGLDEGTEFSFFVHGRDGAEFIISVVESKPCETNGGMLARIPPLLKRRDEQQRKQERKEARRWTERENARLASLERRRKKWLGETDA